MKDLQRVWASHDNVLPNLSPQIPIFAVELGTTTCSLKDHSLENGNRSKTISKNAWQPQFIKTYQNCLHFRPITVLVGTNKGVLETLYTLLTHDRIQEALPAVVYSHCCWESAEPSVKTGNVLSSQVGMANGILSPCWLALIWIQ